MHKLFTFIILIFTMLGLAPALVFAEEEFTYIQDEQGVVITGYTGENTNVVIPDTIEDIAVYAIGEEAFFANEIIESVSLNQNIKSIGLYAFASCPKLENISFMEGLVSLEEGAFQYCTQLNNVFLPEGLQTISNNVFYGCNSLEEMYIPESVMYLGIQAFGYIDDENSMPVVNKDFVLDCVRDSFAYVYARENGIVIKGDFEELLAEDILLENKKFYYNTSKQKVKVTVIHKEITLIEGVDYVLTYSNNLYAGTASVKVTGIGYYKGEYEFNYEILPCDINELETSIKKTEYTYTGKAIKPEVLIYINGKRVYSKRSDGTVNYSVIYINNTNSGMAKAKITATGNFSGSIVKSFKIIPERAVKLKQINYNSTTKIPIKWNVAKGANGYELYRATSKDGAFTKVGATSNSNFTDSGLKSGTTYYYKVRSYKRDSVTGIKVYGYYSGVFAGTTKPSIPTLKVSAGSKRAVLTWNAVTGAKGYEVYICSKSNGKYLRMSRLSDVYKYTKKGLVSGRYYYFKIRAYTTNLAGSKVYSDASKAVRVRVK